MEITPFHKTWARGCSFKGDNSPTENNVRVITFHVGLQNKNWSFYTNTCIFKSLQEFSEKVDDGDHKLRATKELCEKTARKTSQPGREVLRREMDHLQGDWEDYIALMSQADEDLGNALVQWGEFEGKFGACNAWLKDIEQQVKNYELKSTLPEKQAQVDKFKVGYLVVFISLICVKKLLKMM